MDNRAIGIFDSGVGGLTVVKEVMKVLPNEEIIYFGDTARVPYGSKSKETVTKFSSQIIKFLMSKNVKAIIIACNTVSSNCYYELVKQFDIPIIEVVTPGVESCVKYTKNNIVAVIGTEATIRSGAYEKRLKEMKPEIVVYSKACPLFVPLAEEGWINGQITEMIAKKYLDEIVVKRIDSIVLGCTHYPLLKDCIAKVVGKDVKIVNPAVATAQKMKDFLYKNDMLNCNKNNENAFYVSDNYTKFNLMCNLALNKNYIAKKIDLEIY